MGLTPAAGGDGPAGPCVGVVSGLPADLTALREAFPDVELVDLRSYFRPEIEAGYPRRRLAGWSRPGSTVPAGGAAAGRVTIATSDQFVPATVVARLPRLEWFHLQAAGSDLVRHTDLWGSPVLLTCARGRVATSSIAEYVLAGVLAFARGLNLGAAGPVERHRFPSRSASALTVGVVGLGGIGSTVERVLRPWVRRVVGYTSPYRPPTADPDRSGVDELARTVHECDVLVLCCPATDRTRHLVDERLIARMRPGTYVVNVGRPVLVDEAALQAGVRSGRVAGALLDAVEDEEGSRCSPLHRMPAITITPHVAIAKDVRLDDVHLRIFMEMLGSYLAGAPLAGVVSYERGY